MMQDYVKDYKVVVTEVEKVVGERSEIINRRGNIVVPRKYHMTDSQVNKLRTRWADNITNISESIKSSVSSSFFNPYRENGAYYGGIQALFLLGGNIWHSYVSVRDKMQEDMSTRHSDKNRNSWDKFALRSAREGAITTKDLMGRIVQNFRTLQRLGGVHPYGYKLKQVLASIDIKRESDGIYYFRLNTSFNNIDDVIPYYDVNSYQKPCNTKRLILKNKKSKEVVVNN